MKNIGVLGASILFAIAMVVNAAEPSPLLVGHFSNLKISSGHDPHFVSGYRVSIYKSGSHYFGDVDVGVGAPEPTKGVLYDIKLAQATKKLSFKAKFSPGVEFRKGIGSGGREARALLVFSGKVDDRSLSGTMASVDGYKPLGAATRVSIVMKREDDDYVPETYEEWKTLFAPSL